jgi:Putative 2OG-Fe(II) oxygenase
MHPFEFRGFVELSFSENQLTPIKEEIKGIMDSNFKDSIPHSHKLVGQIKKEFQLVNSYRYIEDLLFPHVYRYAHEMNLLSKKQGDSRPVLQRVWVNFQEKHEFNPLHKHSGDVSFVLWIKIPYSLEDEFKIYPDTLKKCASTFEFVHISSTGEIASQILPVDKSWENKLIMFPSEIHHCVHPFYTSDGFRISVSGNFVFQNV